MDKSLLRVLLIVVFGWLSLVHFAARATAAEDAPGKPSILEVVELSGEIGPATASLAQKMVEQVNENKRIKAVLLVVNTPGGGAVASAAVYEELSKLKVPVVVWCDHMCASGGMYLAMAPSVKYIGVRSETIAGSIGVVANVTRFNRLLDWLRIDNETFVSGNLKDAGNPTRAGREDERKYLQGIISSLAESFYQVVGKSRKVKDWPEVKTGRIFIGAEAVKVGLADAVMTREQAIKKAKDLSGAKLIFTKDEMKKMSAVADESSPYMRPVVVPMSQFGDVPALVEIVKEIRAGESVRFEYRMPYRF